MRSCVFGWTHASIQPARVRKCTRWYNRTNEGNNIQTRAGADIREHCFVLLWLPRPSWKVTCLVSDLLRATMKGTFPLRAINTNEEIETLSTRWHGSPHPTPQGIQWMVPTKQTPDKITWGRYRRNYQTALRERAQELICGGRIIWKNLFGFLETLVEWTYKNIPEASERKWTRCSQVSGIGIKGADTVENLQQGALRSVFGDDQQLFKNKLRLYCISLGDGLEESKVPIAEFLNIWEGSNIEHTFAILLLWYPLRTKGVPSMMTTIKNMERTLPEVVKGEIRKLKKTCAQYM